jgi:hypothetical protein
MTEVPVAWRVWWYIPSNKPFDPTYKHKREYKDFPSLALALTEKLYRAHSLGEDGAVCLEPRYLSRRKRETKRLTGQDNLAAAGWPLQMRPPR